ncbi:YfhO family protein [Mucilaginibacter calamicampi]|uniref:YfhO family protein n=1 Tax=Mucilaginibacter calamicampi TaxID=1302352 RepID=A0ABW2YWH2_9SPHI
MNNWFKRNGIHFAIIGIFFIMCFIYFTPAFQGKILGQGDVTGAQSTQTEINAYKEKGQTILWTNQIFGGMPAFQIWVPYTNNITSHVIIALKAIFPNPIDTVMILLAGAYFLFIVLRINPWLAAAGAVAFTFSSYNIIYIVAGHSNQTFAIAFFAPIVASIILTLRGKHILGGTLTAFFLAMEIRANHLQMTYYLMLAILILVIIEVYHAVKNKTMPQLAKSIGFLAIGLGIAVAVNASMLWSNAEYAKYTIRGQSNLKSSADEPSTGLAKDYAYQWSQGVGECLTFLVPNAYGGETGKLELDEKSATAKAFIAKGASVEDAARNAGQIGAGAIKGLGTYWGNKSSTSGPWYFGAVVCFLFVFGLIIVKDRLKWWILFTVILTMLLSFGGNFPFVSDLFFNYFPLYNKFRAVESILAVTMLCFPLLAILAVKELIDNTDKKALQKKALLSLYITGGIALILAVLPEVVLSFRPSDQTEGVNMLTQYLKGDNSFASAIANGIVQDRISFARMDAIRTLVFVALAFGVVFLYIKQKINVTVLSLAFLVLVLVDLWQVDKRYLKDENFAPKQASNKPEPREVDTFMSRDTDPNFRVFDATANVKFDTFNPFYYKSFGGYSAARLKRFEELLDNQFTKTVNQDVLDMLNVKYILSTDPGNQSLKMQVNSTACGNAWFVKSVKYAKTADQEMQAISSFDPKQEAIVNDQYKNQVGDKTMVDPLATIKLVHYSPDTLKYQSGSTVEQIAVFSEIYYDNGWTMYIDGKESPYFRADYLLRAAKIPVGNHNIEFVFHPASYYTGESISLAGSVLLVLAIGAAGYIETRKKAAKKA